MEPTTTSPTRWNYTTIYLYHPYILCHLSNYALCSIICEHSRVVEGSGVSIVLHGCVVHVDVHGCGSLQLNCY